MRIGFLILITAIVCLPLSGWADFYRYVDKNGALRFTDNLADVPKDQRPKMHRYEEPTPSPVSDTGTARPGAKAPGDSMSDPISGKIKGEAQDAGVLEKRKSDALPLAEIEKLIKKKAALDKESKDLEGEREALSEERKQLKTQEDGAAFKKKAARFNQRVSEYETRRKAFDAEIKVYNDSTKK